MCHTYIEIPKTLPNDTPENLEKKLDVLNKNRDSITVISKSPTGEADNKIINLTIKKNGEIVYTSDGVEIKLELHDDYSNDTLRKSLWPVVYK